MYAVLTQKHEDRTVFENDRTNIEYGVLIPPLFALPEKVTRTVYDIVAIAKRTKGPFISVNIEIVYRFLLSVLDAKSAFKRNDAHWNDTRT